MSYLSSVKFSAVISSSTDFSVSSDQTYFRAFGVAFPVFQFFFHIFKSPISGSVLFDLCVLNFRSSALSSILVNFSIEF